MTDEEPVQAEKRHHNRNTGLVIKEIEFTCCLDITENWCGFCFLGRPGLITEMSVSSVSICGIYLENCSLALTIAHSLSLFLPIPFPIFYDLNNCNLWFISCGNFSPTNLGKFLPMPGKMSVNADKNNDVTGDRAVRWGHSCLQQLWWISQACANPVVNQLGGICTSCLPESASYLKDLLIVKFAWIIGLPGAVSICSHPGCCN